MRIVEEKDLKGGEVLEFLSGNASSTFFHTPAWMESLTGTFKNMEASYIVARDGKDIAGLMPVCRIHRAGFHILSALPFGTYGTPVSRDRVVVRSILERFVEVSSYWRCVSAGANLYGIDDALPSGLDSPAEGECRVVDIGHGFAWYRSSQMSRKKRQTCNGCEKEGVEVRPLVDEEELDRFYAIYKGGSSCWGGVHPYPAALFRHLFAKRSEGVVIWGAFRGTEMLGGHIDMYFGKKAQAWQAGMPRGADGTGLAGYLVYKAVEEACRLGMEEFNLGASGRDEGMIFFKESMGGEKRTYPVIEKRKNWWKILKK